MISSASPPTANRLDAPIKEVTELLAKFSTPLYQYDSDHRPELIGTGFFVKAGGSSFLVSAAHVLDVAKNRGLFFYIAPKTTRNLSGRLIRSNHEDNRHSDLIDVGVLRLSAESEPPYPEVDKFAMEPSYLRPRFRPRTAKAYAVIGFPATKNRASGARREVSAIPYAFHHLEPIDEGQYESHGLQPDTHIALKLDVRRGFGPGGTKQHFPDPYGMSGSPIVVLYDLAGDENVTRVVGVATTYRKHSRLVFGTDIGYVIQMMENPA